MLKHGQRPYNCLNLISYLLETFTNNLNSNSVSFQIVLGTINSPQIAVEWLRSTFLYVRVQKNPMNYKLKPLSTLEQIEKKLKGDIILDM